MRFVPLVRSEDAPEPWAGFPVVELYFTGQLHAGWARQIAQGREIHALHLGAERPLAEAVQVVLGAGLETDFLVLPVEGPPEGGEEARLLPVLEALQELTKGRGPKLVLKPSALWAEPLAARLEGTRAGALGWCWHPGLLAEFVGPAGIQCAVTGPSDDLEPLARHGYRWNVAVPGLDPSTASRVLEGLARRHPFGGFPPLACSPRALPPRAWDESGLRLGAPWGVPIP